MARDLFASLRVLVVDDNEPMRAVLCCIVDSLGAAQVDQCGDPAAALDEARRLRPDVIIADLAMAPVDGLEFTRNLRGDPDHPASAVPIVMVTGFSDKSHVEAARDAGVSEFLGKPVTLDAVAARLRSVIENPRPFIRSNSFTGPDRRRRQAPIAPESDRRLGGESADPGALAGALPR